MDFKLPELGEGVYEAEMVRWLVKEGDEVQPGRVLLEVLTDKATMEVPAPFAGKIEKLRAEEGAKLKIGDAILSYAAPAKSTTTGGVAPTPAETAPTVQTPGTERRVTPSGDGKRTAVKAAPSVRLMARKLGIELDGIQGSGPQGRILIDDLTRHAEPAKAPVTTAAAGAPADLAKPGTRIKLQGIRRKIADQMVLSKRTIPHYSYVDECDVTALVALRESLKEPFASRGVKLTYLAFFVKAVVGALKMAPIANASLDEEAGEIVLHDKYHIGVAVNAPAGLVVPVVHDADRLSLLEIAREIERLSNDARQGKSRLEDLRGGTFTVTSIGNIGGLIATPIILHPQVGILGVGKIVKRPVFDERGQVRAADMVYLSFSFDHRVLDGAVGAAFGNAVIERMKAPAALLVD